MPRIQSMILWLFEMVKIQRETCSSWNGYKSKEELNDCPGGSFDTTNINWKVSWERSLLVEESAQLHDLGTPQPNFSPNYSRRSCFNVCVSWRNSCVVDVRAHVSRRTLRKIIVIATLKDFMMVVLDVSILLCSKLPSWAAQLKSRLDRCTVNVSVERRRMHVWAYQYMNVSAN